MEVLIALSLTGLVFTLAANHIGILARGWFQMESVRDRLVSNQQIERAFLGYMMSAQGELALAQSGRTQRLTSNDQALILDTAENTLLWERPVPVLIELPEVQFDWAFSLSSDNQRLDLLDASQVVVSSERYEATPLPCVFDTINRRCLGATQ